MVVNNGDRFLKKFGFASLGEYNRVIVWKLEIVEFFAGVFD